MRIIFRITKPLLDKIRIDLRRPHPFASERVGFVTVRGMSTSETMVLIAAQYSALADQDYIDDPRVGAMMGQEGIRKALETALLKNVGMFHVHMHARSVGQPAFSKIDRQEQLKFVPDFFKVRPQMPHGALVLGRTRAFGHVWVKPNHFSEISEFNVIGAMMQIDRVSNARGPDGEITL